MKGVIRRVCFEFDVNPDDVYFQGLGHDVSLARKVIVYFLYQSHDNDFIKKRLDLKARSAVYSAVSWVRDRMAIDKDFKQKVINIKTDLK